jgi:hypothetical protein
LPRMTGRCGALIVDIRAVETILSRRFSTSRQLISAF